MMGRKEDNTAEKVTFASRLWPTRPFRLLYASYAFSCIGDRLWTFALILLLERLGGMRLVSTNQLLDGFSSILLSTYVGNWLDRHDRRVGTLTVLLMNNFCVGLSALLLAVCLVANDVDSDDPSTARSILYGAALTLSILFCAVSKCASEGQRLALTKDWIVVMASREDGETLSSRNAAMTTIDQFSSVLAPLTAGYILLQGGHRLACLVIVAWNMLSWVVERQLLSLLYAQVEELRRRSKDREGTSASASDETVKDEIEELLRQEVPQSSGSGAIVTTSLMRRMLCAISAYRRQSIYPAAIGLALLYMTVLGFDGLAISHGKSQDVPDNVLGVFRSAGSVMGILGACSYSLAERRVGVRRTGLIGLTIQHFALWFCVASIWMPGSPFDLHGYWEEAWGPTLPLNATVSSPLESPPAYSVSPSILSFLIGVTTARFGLWMADLSITQLMQETILERERGTVFGVQNGFCQLFSVLKDLAVVAMPSSKTFGLLILTSCVSVFAGYLHYCYYLWRSAERGKVNMRKMGCAGGRRSKERGERGVEARGKDELLVEQARSTNT